MSWEIDRAAIGQWGPETTMRVEYGKVREFARAIKDDNAAFAGDEALAPPTFLMTIAHWTEGACAPSSSTCGGSSTASRSSST